MHKSIATIDSPEFINLQPLDISPFMSKCEIKVLYLGENRNHSYIDEATARNMAKTLRGAPIVGYYKSDKEDFADHGNRVIFDDEGIKFECLTKPYGFVAPDAEIWFQTFEDIDDFGNIETRKYLMTTGYLWTEQYEECKKVIETGRPQSMELDENSLDGKWEYNPKDGIDYFIINDAIFSKLCILGDEVEPCFEGARVTAPEASAQFSKIDDGFKQTLFSMMQELKSALEGGQPVEKEKTEFEAAVEAVAANETSLAEESAAVTEFTTADKKEEKDEKTTEEQEEKKEEAPASDVDKDKEESSNKEKEEETEEEKTGSSDEEKASDSEEKSDAQEEEKKKYALLETEFVQLKDKYSALEEKYNELVAFKQQVEDLQKDEMIKSFYFLSDEDKKEVIENKSKYSLEEIESKLSVISVRNRVNFDLGNSKENVDKEESVITTFTVGSVGPSVPAWIAAIKNNQKK